MFEATGWEFASGDGEVPVVLRSPAGGEYTLLQRYGEPEVFPAGDLARQAGEAGGCMTAVYNAANEEAAEAFLAGRIRFPTIVRTIADVVGGADQWSAEPATVEEVLEAQRWARQRARELVEVAAQEVASPR